MKSVLAGVAVLTAALSFKVGMSMGEAVPLGQGPPPRRRRPHALGSSAPTTNPAPRARR